MNLKWIVPLSLVIFFQSNSWAQQSSYAAYLAVVQELSLSDIRTTILNAGTHGLNPKIYWTDGMEKLFRAGGVAHNELRPEADRAYLLLLQHASIGIVDPESMGIDVKIKRKSFISAKNLQTLRLISANRAMPLLGNVVPQNSQYNSLKEALRRFTIYCQSPWEKIPSISKAIKKGDSHNAMPAIKRRLKQLGYRISSVDNTFDTEAESAVNDIQWTLAMKPDGTISPGGKTLRYLEKSCESRIQQIRLDMEKVRWFPQKFEDRHIFVNLASAHFNLTDKTGHMTFKTIVGRDARKTPTMSDRITYIVLNPYWVVPPTIFREDKMEEIRSLDPSQVNAYFESRNYEVWNRAFTKKIDPSTIDWWKDNPNLDMEIYIRQKPSTANALGVLKFMMTNSFAIYLHDTNQPELFSSARRQISSGCVRLERPFDLAEYLLRGTKWTRAEIENHVAKPGEVMSRDTRVNLAQAMPVYMAALTSQLSSDGVTRFTEDIYKQNARLIEKGALMSELANELGDE